MNTPLVSVVVITYNSSKYVLETLESAKAQTYQNIELVVSDDCSTDNTVELCRNWIEQNKARFVRTELILSEKNTGISANCNRGYKAAQGEWIKGIAGDDILMDECIELNIDYIRHNKCSLVISKIRPFGKMCSSNTIDTSNLCFRKAYETYIESKEKLLKLTCFKYSFSTPSFFINRIVWNNVGGFDERIPFLEDWPFMLRFLESKNNIGFLDLYTVLYRVEESITRDSSQIVPTRFYKSQKLVYELYLYPRLLNQNEYLRYWALRYKDIRMSMIVNVFRNRINVFISLFLKLSRILDPEFYFTLD